MGCSSIGQTADCLSTPHNGLLVISFARFPNIPSLTNNPDHTTVMSTTHTAARYAMAHVTPLRMASKLVICMGSVPLSRLSISPQRTRRTGSMYILSTYWLDNDLNIIR